jgi:hypothetical protein
MAESPEQFSQDEVDQRFKKLVGLALKSQPKPIKSMGPKGVPAQSKKRQTKRRAKKVA